MLCLSLASLWKFSKSTKTIIRMIQAISFLKFLKNLHNFPLEIPQNFQRELTAHLELLGKSQPCAQISYCEVYLHRTNIVRCILSMYLFLRHEKVHSCPELKVFNLIETTSRLIPRFDVHLSIGAWRGGLFWPCTSLCPGHICQKQSLLTYFWSYVLPFPCSHGA